MGETRFILLLSICYYVPARLIFGYVYDASPTIIDEMFHLPIGLKYCQKNFSMWDNKITTLPGLYLFSTLMAAPFGICTVYFLRYTVFLTSMINLVLIYHLRKQWLPNECRLNRMLNAFNITTTPPILFFSMVYYTDILSMTLVNAMILFGLMGGSFTASIFGFLAMITRQNNAVYVLFIAGYQVLGHAYNIVTGTRYSDGKIRKWDSRYLKIKLKSFKASNTSARDYFGVLIEGLCYAAALISMIVFVYLNGGVVVGDKTAHSTTFHIPQLLYYSLFVMFFGWPHACCYILPFSKFLYRKFLLSIFLLAIISTIVHCNTIVHPYLLADNRHYLFYVWKYFLATEIQRQVTCPMYLCGLYCLCRLVYRNAEPRFAIVYPLMLVVILCTQSLIDVRYFLTPYVILRTFVAPTTRIDLVIELFFQTAVSGFTLYTLGRKEIYWDDIEDVQRLIW